ncbi:MAG: hypothetical protein ABI333_00700 [bacterium]
MVPISFLLGALAGGLLVRYWHARSDTPEASIRRQKLKLVAVSALATTLFLGVSGFAAFRYKFRAKPMSKASTAEAVADFRKAGGSTAAERKGLPPGGVYTYHAKGHLKVESALFGNIHRPLPKTIPAVLIVKGKCWELGLRLFKQHQRTERYCKSDGGVKLEQRWEKNLMFGIETFTRQQCGPHGILGPTGKPGSTWTSTWKVLEHKTTMPLPMKRPDLELHITYVGVTKLDIGGRQVSAHHLRQNARFTGPVSGTLNREVWYAVDTGLMLKLHVKSQGSGMATVTIDRRYTLASLTPKK